MVSKILHYKLKSIGINVDYAIGSRRKEGEPG